MAQITLQKEFLPLPLSLNNSSFLFVPEYQFHLDELKTFFSNREGSRLYYPQWGFNFNSSEDSYTSDELKALINLKLNQFFSYLNIVSVEVQEITYGNYLVEITLVQNAINQTVTLTLNG